jgi:predicted nuclease with TOPRIM domain
VQDGQLRIAKKDQKIKELMESVKRLETEKVKLSEKWIKLSAKNKNEDKLKQKIKELETSNLIKDQETMKLYTKMQEIEMRNVELQVFSK